MISTRTTSVLSIETFTQCLKDLCPNYGTNRTRSKKITQNPSNSNLLKNLDKLNILQWLIISRFMKSSKWETNCSKSTNNKFSRCWPKTLIYSSSFNKEGKTRWRFWLNFSTWCTNSNNNSPKCSCLKFKIQILLTRSRFKSELRFMLE